MIPRGMMKEPEAVPALSEAEKRRKALEFREKYGHVTDGKADAGGHVTGAGGADSPAAESGETEAGKAPPGSKIAKKSAVARSAQAGETRKLPEAARTNPNRRENEFMMNLMILRNSLARNAPECRDRARLAGKYVWRDIRLMYRLVCKVQDALLDTMPKRRTEYYLAYAKSGHYELVMNGPVRSTRHLLVTDRNLAVLAEEAMSSACMMCLKDGSEIEKCPLRAALLESAVPTHTDPDGRIHKCEYADAARQLVRGENVTI